jgi:hypothetical protein
MKNLLWIIANIIMATTLVSCKSENKKSLQDQTTNKVTEQPVEVEIEKHYGFKLSNRDYDSVEVVKKKDDFYFVCWAEDPFTTYSFGGGSNEVTVKQGGMDRFEWGIWHNKGLTNLEENAKPISIMNGKSKNFVKLVFLESDERLYYVEYNLSTYCFTSKKKIRL